jgi:hypothetical protein
MSAWASIKRFLWIAAAGVFLSSQSGALETNTSVFPEGFENSEGNYFSANLFRVPTTYQQITMGTTLENQWQTPVLIESVAFRANGSSSFNYQTTIPKIEIQLSTTSRTAGSISMNWDANRGAETQTVYLQENVNISATGTLVLNPFDLKFQFTEPFLYDPRSGNLAVKITTFGTTPFAGGGAVDAQLYEGPNANSTVGSYTSSELFVRAGGLVAEYTFVSVPEPHSFLLLFVAAGLFLAPKIPCFRK